MLHVPIWLHSESLQSWQQKYQLAGLPETSVFNSTQDNIDDWVSILHIYLAVHLDGVVDERFGGVEARHHVVDSEVVYCWLESGLLCIH